MLTRRLQVALAAGVILGVFCILGASARSGFSREADWLFALWYNRVLLGLVIGLPWKPLGLGLSLGRGAVLGLVVSLAFYSADGFSDGISFLVGGVYGVIIEYVAWRWGNHGTAGA